MFKQVRPRVGLLGRISQVVRQSRFPHLPTDVGTFDAPVLETTAESMGNRGYVEPPQHRREHHIRQRLPPVAGKHQIAVGSAEFSTDRRIDSDLPDNGTWCSRRAFIRSAGTVHFRSLMSISDQVANLTSPLRAAVSTRNSNANFVTSSAVDSLILFNAPGTSR